MDARAGRTPSRASSARVDARDDDEQRGDAVARCARADASQSSLTASIERLHRELEALLAAVPEPEARAHADAISGLKSRVATLRASALATRAKMVRIHAGAKAMRRVDLAAVLDDDHDGLPPREDLCVGERDDDDDDDDDGEVSDASASASASERTTGTPRSTRGGGATETDASGDDWHDADDANVDDSFRTTPGKE